MRKYLLIVLSLIALNEITAQTVIKMERINGVYVMPCKVNGLALRFIFDTGASDVSISITEALFMLKNGYLSNSDILGSEYYRIANGDIQEGTKVVLKTIEIGKLRLTNIKASIVHSLSAPLLLGQSALSRLGKMEFDYSKNTLTFTNGPSDYVYNQSPQTTNYAPESEYTGSYMFKTSFDRPQSEVPLRSEPNVESREVYKCPKDAVVYVLDNSGKVYIKVYVNGYTGFVSKALLKRQW